MSVSERFALINLAVFNNPLSALWPVAELAKLAHFPSLPSLSISLHLSPSLSASPSVHIGRRIDRLGEKEIHEIYIHILEHVILALMTCITNHWKSETTGLLKPLESGIHWIWATFVG